MGLQKRAKTLSAISRTLLAEGESERADFKRSPDGVSAEDLVAFANSDAGGEILVGVDEHTRQNTQVGIVRGCDVSDATILQILNKAVSCFPPISVNIFIENLNSKPILRIAVPSSKIKPHCTPKGIYCLRDGSRNRPLQPSELLKIFLDTEARAFAERFESAAVRIAEDLSELEKTLDSSIKNMADQLGWTDLQLGDTESTLTSILGYIRRLDGETNDISSRLRSIFRQDKRNDPIQIRERREFVNQLVEQLRGDQDLLRQFAAGATLTIKAQGKAAQELTEEDLKAALNEAVEIVRTEEDLKKYKIAWKSPAKFTGADLDRFATILSEGGEESDGIKSRIKNAFRLGAITYEGKMVGTAALKKPEPSYRADVFGNARSHAEPKNYPFELDWTFLQTEHQKKGQMTKLLELMMPLVKNRGIFAIARSGNELMVEVLTQFSFEPNGVTFPSTQNPSQTLRLFIRPGKSDRR